MLCMLDQSPQMRAPVAIPLAYLVTPAALLAVLTDGQVLKWLALFGSRSVRGFQ